MKQKNIIVSRILFFLIIVCFVGVLSVGFHVNATKDEMLKTVEKTSLGSRYIDQIALNAWAYEKSANKEDLTQLKNLLENLSYSFIALAQESHNTPFETLIFSQDGLHKNIILLTGLLHQYMQTKQLAYLESVNNIIPTLTMQYDKVRNEQKNEFKKSLQKLNFLFMALVLVLAILIFLLYFSYRQDKLKTMGY